jgi:Mn2+/Fe2+ NRAMP family transporter
MNRVLMLALGVLSAIGGFVDIGDLVFNAQAGALFGYQLLWVLPIGVLGIILYSEMCGRVAAVTGRTVFDAVRERMGFQVSLLAFASAAFVSLMTLVAEIGGVALALQLLVGGPYEVLVAIGALLLGLAVWNLSFTVIENLFSLLGLALLVFVVGALVQGVDWSAFVHGFVPGAPSAADGAGLTDNRWTYAYFVVGLVGAAMTPYEVYFFSSGAIEDGWTRSELTVDKVTAILGYGLGGLLSAALMAIATLVLLPRGIAPDSIATIASMAQEPLGIAGLLLASAGILFATGGAAIETLLSAAYVTCQMFGWNWGLERGTLGAPRFTILWVVVLVGAAVVTLTGLDPVQVTEYSVVFSAVALPLTYLPILLVANDRSTMGDRANGVLARPLGWAYLAVVCVVAVCAVPLMLLTHGGQLR